MFSKRREKGLLKWDSFKKVWVSINFLSARKGHKIQKLSGPVLRDTARLSQQYPLLRAMGFLVSQHGQVGAIPPPPFLSVSPLKSMRSGGAIPPPPPHKGGISAIPARYPMKTRRTRAIPPSAIPSRKGIARHGGVSRTGPLSSEMPIFHAQYDWTTGTRQWK